LRHEKFVVAPDQVSTAFVSSLAICLAGGLLFWITMFATILAQLPHFLLRVRSGKEKFTKARNHGVAQGL